MNLTGTNIKLVAIMENGETDFVEVKSTGRVRADIEYVSLGQVEVDDGYSIELSQKRYKQLTDDDVEIIKKYLADPDNGVIVHLVVGN